MFSPNLTDFLVNICPDLFPDMYLGPVVQSIVTSKYTDIFIEETRKAFALQKLFTFFFQQKYKRISDIFKIV